MNRYSNRRNTLSVGRQSPSGGILRTILILLLIIALAVSLVMGVPAIRYRNEAHQFYAERMLNECDEALTRASSLSRTGGTSQMALAIIRSKVYAMDLLNQTNSVLTGGQTIVSEAVFTQLYGTLESYITKTTIGAADTGDLQTELTNSLEALRTQLSTLQ